MAKEAKTELEQLRASQLEWQAWQDYIGELRKLIPDAIDINGPAFKPMFDSIYRWGETLVRLRVMQDPDVRERAYQEYEEKWKSRQ